MGLLMPNGEAERPSAAVQNATRAHNISLCSRRCLSQPARPLQRLLGGNLDVVHTTRWGRNRSAILPHSFKVKFNRLAN